MQNQLTPISFDRHKGKKIRPLADHNHAKDYHFASAMVHEFTRCVLHYPIVFLEDQQIEGFRPACLLGLSEGENLFVQNGQWISPYIPAMLKRYPFALVQTQEDDRFAICVDESSGVIQDEEGERLFDDQGEPSEVLKNIRQFLGEIQQMEAFTLEFSKHIKSLDLFSPMDLTVKVKGQDQKLGGCYMINEEKMNALSDSDYLGLREKKYMAPIYSHLSSLAQIDRLVVLKNARG